MGCFEECIHADASNEGWTIEKDRPPVRGKPGAGVPYQPGPPRPSKRTVRILLAVGAIVSVFLARVTGFDQGLFDDLLKAVIPIEGELEPGMEGQDE